MSRSKYNARSIQYDGLNFDSKAEARRYRELCLLATIGKISDLKVHPVFELQPGFVDNTKKRQRAIIYEADFSYIERGNQLPVIEDVKGIETAVWKVKKKMFLYHYPEYELRIVK